VCAVEALFLTAHEIGVSAVIKSIEINGFRGIRTGCLKDLTPLVILVGPNGSGKSTILEAAVISASANPNGAVQECIDRRDKREPRWLLLDAAQSSSSALTTDTGDRAELDLVLERNRIRAAFRQNGKGPVQPLALSVRLVDAAVRDATSPLHSLYTKAVELGHRLAVQEIVREVISGANSVEILTDEKNQPILQIVFDGYTVPGSLVGDGIQRVLRLVLELASLHAGTVLMEEPEVFQHPGAIRLTAQAIVAAVRRDIQVILTTHSLELIDALLAAANGDDLELVSVYRLDLAQGELRSHRLPGPEAAFARSQIEDDLR